MCLPLGWPLPLTRSTYRMSIHAKIRNVYGPQAESLFIIINRQQHSLMVLDARGEPLAPRDATTMTVLLDLLEESTQQFGGGETTLAPYDAQAESGLPWEVYLPKTG